MNDENSKTVTADEGTITNQAEIERMRRPSSRAIMGLIPALAMLASIPGALPDPPEDLFPSRRRTWPNFSSSLEPGDPIPRYNPRSFDRDQGDQAALDAAEAKRQRKAQKRLKTTRA